MPPVSLSGDIPLPPAARGRFRRFRHRHRCGRGRRGARPRKEIQARSRSASSASARWSSSCSSSLFARGHCLFVGVPGLAKTLLISTLAEVLNLQLQPHPVHARPHAVRHHRHRRPRGGPRHRPARLPLHPGPDLRQHRARRRDQPHAAQDAGRAAAGDAGAPRHRRRPAPTRCARRSSSSPRRTPSSRRAPIPLPEAQLDRFMFLVDVGYPAADEEVEIVKPADQRAPADRSSKVLSPERILRAAGAGAARAGRRPRRALRGGAGARTTRPELDGRAGTFVQATRVLVRAPGPRASQFLILGGEGARDPRRARRRRRSKTCARWPVPTLQHRADPQLPRRGGRRHGRAASSISACCDAVTP